jgi:Tfp pilus assembly protein PilN
VKAVNLIPADARRGGPGGASALPQAPAAVLLGLLAASLGLVTVYVLTSNKISQNKVKIAAAQAQLTAVQAQVAGFDKYKQFTSLADARAQTVIQVATARFDWQTALADLSQVVPANTSLQTLLGSVAPDVSVSGAGGSSSAGGAATLRNAIPNPAFELAGCTKTQDDVARLMSRLRLINGVIRVSLADSTKSGGGQVGTNLGSASSNAGVGCGSNHPTFDLVVFFKPLPGGAATVGTSTTTQGVGTTTSSTTTTTPGSATTPGTTGTTPATTTTTPATTTTTPSSYPTTTGSTTTGAPR